MKIIISTGLGRLHLIDTASSLKNKDIDIKVITGWVVPKWFPNEIINFLGLFLGRKNLSYGLRRRNNNSLVADNFISIWVSEFFNSFLFVLSSISLIPNNYATALGWYFHGFLTRKYIKNADLLHIRSGAGVAGVIRLAKSRGLVVIVDHSAAHPLEIVSQLKKVYSISEIPVNPNFGLWKYVIDDCNNADILLVNSNYVKSTFIKHGFPDSKIEVLNLGIRSDFHGVKTTYKIGNELVVLFTGNIKKWKGIEVIIEAALILMEKNVRFKFILVGQLSEPIIFPENLVNSGVLELVGHIPQDLLVNFFIKSDIYVFPSYCEGSAQSLKEAMGAGLPVIATFQSGAPIVDGESGIIIEDDSPFELARAIILLMKNEEIRERIGKNAALEIGKNHNWEKYSDNLINLYRREINKK